MTTNINLIPADYIICADYILTMNDNMDMIRDGAVAIQGNKILATDTKANILNKYQTKQLLDKKGHVLLPGLINTHTHAPMVYLRGIADDLPLKEWLEQHIWPLEKKWLSKDFVYDATKLACLEMLTGGTTTFADMYFFNNDLARATKEMGMRGIIATTVFDFPSVIANTTDEYFSVAEEFVKNWRGDGLITPAIGPHAAYTCGTETLQRTQEFAAKFNLPIQIHIAETAWEVEEIQKRYGKRPVKYLDSIGFLNEKVLAAHCVWVDDEEIAILAKHKVGVAHCIESNLKLASGFMPLPKMLKAGVRVAFGTDGAASNNDLNLLLEISTAAKVHKAVINDSTVVDAKSALYMATRGAANALNMSTKIGVLAEGACADIISIDLQKPHLMPLYDVYSQIVYTATAQDVDMTMINGKLIMNERNLLACDAKEILEVARNWQRKIKKL